MKGALVAVAVLIVLPRTVHPPFLASDPRGRDADRVTAGPAHSSLTDNASDNSLAPTTPSAAAITLDEAMVLAMTSNRTLVAARLKASVADAGILVAREYPNPEFTFEESKETPHDAFTLSQPFETAGKRRRRIAVARAETRSAEAEAGTVAADVRSQVRRAYAELAAAQLRSAETAALAALAQRTTEAARDRFDSGAAPKLEVLQSELGSSQADNEADTSRAELFQDRAELNTLLAREPESPIEAADGLDAGQVPSVEWASALAVAGSVEVASLDRRIEEALARADLARAAQVPDFVLSGALTRRAQPEFDTGWRAALTVTLPVFTRYRGAVVVQTRAVEQLRAEREAARAVIRGRVVGAVARAAALREQLLRYRDHMLPQAAEVEGMAEDSYRSGQSSLVSMIQTIQSSRDVRLRAVQAGLDYQLALDDLEKAMGARLPRSAGQ